MRIGQNMNFRSFYSIFFFKRAGAIGRLPLHLTLLILGSMLFSISAEAQTNAANSTAGRATVETISQLRQKVAEFVIAQYQTLHVTKVEVKVGALDSRLRLAACNETLAFNLLDTTGNGGNVNVQVVCNRANTASGRWTILVPTFATVFRPVAIAGRALQRGEPITAADVETEIRDMSQYRQGFALEANLVIGKEAKYPIAKGEAFRTSALGAPLVIKRGEEVSIQATVGAISVVTNGIATGDGRLGQQIRVKNNQSERIINARVVGPGKVQSLM
jgi:flagellar basal body P-ring formation protein FlgA